MDSQPARYRHAADAEVLAYLRDNPGWHSAAEIDRALCPGDPEYYRNSRQNHLRLRLMSMLRFREVCRKEIGHSGAYPRAFWKI